MRRWDFKLSELCEHVRLPQGQLLEDFTCGDTDIDDFFRKESLLYEKELLSKSYCFFDNKKNCIICAFSLSNDSIKTPLLTKSARNRLQRNIPNEKRPRTYPAVLIGQLGVNANYRNMSIGSQTIEYLKTWLTHSSNKTGCRFILVDSLNNPRTINFYERNGFIPLYSSEQEEREAFMLPSSVSLRTRMMYCDLKLWLQTR